MPADIVTREEARWQFRTLPKYEREFITEVEALERRDFLRDQYPAEGYGTHVSVYRVGQSRWLLLAWWGSCE